MNPFSKRIHQIKNPDLDLSKGTRNPFLDLKSVFGFTERNTPLVTGVQARTNVEQLAARNEGGWLLQSRIWSFACLTRIARWTKKKERLLVVYTFAKRSLKIFVAYDFI